MLQYHSLSNSHNGNDSLDSSYLNPTDVQPPAERVKRLFHDPEHMPTMELVFSEYALRQDTHSPTLRDGALPLSSLRSPSANEMCAREEPSQSSLLLANDSGCKLDERALSDHLRARSRSRHPLTDSDPWSSSLDNPCSPIAHEDTLGSPLQQSIEAYAEIDKDFHPPHPPSTVPARHIGEQHWRGGRKHSHSSVSHYVGSMDSAMTPSLCSDGSTIRGHSLSSSGNTTVEPSSLLTDPENEGDLFDPYISRPPKSIKLNTGHDRHNFPSVDDETRPDVYALSAGSIPEPRRFNDRERERNAELGQKEDSWKALQDAPHPRRDSQPTQSPPSAYDDPNLITPTGSPEFLRHRTSRRDNWRSSLIPSFYSESNPTLEHGNSGKKNRGGLSNVASALHHTYVAISYKVRLAMFRTEKKFSRFRWKAGGEGDTESGV